MQALVRLRKACSKCLHGTDRPQVKKHAPHVGVACRLDNACRTRLCLRLTVARDGHVRAPAGEHFGVQKSTPTAALCNDDNSARHVCARDVETRAAVAGHCAQEHHQDQDGKQPLLDKVDKPLDACPHRHLGALIQRGVVRVHAHHGLDGADAAHHCRDHCTHRRLRS